MGQSSELRTPANDGFRMPAEWEPHAGCFVSWPCKESTWQGHFKEVKNSYAEVISAINRFEPVTVLATPSTIGEARATVGRGVDIVEIELDDSWVRDNGPIFLKNDAGQVAMANFKFNAWGGKFPPFDKDDLVPVRLSERYNMRRYDAPMVLEGGSISIDGEGTLLTTRQCLLNPNRNPNMTQHQIEETLGCYLGIKKVIWLNKGIKGDLTDGHVDGIACFAGPRLVIASHTGNKSDPNYKALAENLSIMQSATDARGRSIEVIDLKQPPPMDFAGHRIAPDYPNHYIANGGVIVPTYGIPQDGVAIEALRSAYPCREIISVNGGFIEIGGGGVHCITQQRPHGPALQP